MKKTELNKLKETIRSYYQGGYHRVDVIKEKENFRIICIEKDDKNITNFNDEGLRIVSNFKIDEQMIRDIKIESLI